MKRDTYEARAPSIRAMVDTAERGRQRRRTVVLVVVVLLSVYLGPSLVVEMMKPRDKAVERARESVTYTTFSMSDAIEDSPAGADAEWKQGAARAVIGPPGDRHKGEYREPVEHADGTVSYFMYVVASGTNGGGWVNVPAYALMCVELVVDTGEARVVNVENAECTDEVRGWTDFDVEADFSRS